MKGIILFVLLCVMAGVANAQWSYKDMARKTHFFYSSGDYVVGKKTAGNLGLNYVYNRKYSVNVGYSATGKTQVSLPAGILKSAKQITPASGAKPFENSENLHLMIGRIFHLSDRKPIRILLQAGPGISTIREPVFNVSGEEYDFDIEATKKLCFVLNPKIEVPLANSVGFSAGPLVVVNNQGQYFGAGIGLMYGIVGR